MFDYLQQFNSLPKDLRDKVSSPVAMAALAELEKKYQLDLAMAVMKVMIKSLAIKNLPAYFISDFNLSQVNAENLSKELVAKIFLSAASYLGLEKEARILDLDTDINLIISEAGLVIPSSDLVNRFKSILSTYLKGVRSKLAARDALTKAVNMGGLNLTPAEVDRVFKICEQKTFKSLEVNLATVSKITPPVSRLDKIIASADGASSEYNLKQALASGQTKKIEPQVSKPEVTSRPEVKREVNKLDTTHELPIPEKELALPLVDKNEIINKTTRVEAAKIEPAKAVVAQTTVRSFRPQSSSTPAAKVMPVPVVAPVVTPVKTPIISPAVAAVANSTVEPKATSEQKKISPEMKPAIKVTPPEFKTVLPPTPIVIPEPVVPKPVAAARPIFAPSILKQAMHDIRPVPKVMGPIEELQFLDLINFRRLGKTPAEITAKIFSKIKLLEADGYDKMVAGVRAWRQSPVNRLYLKMVQEAIGKGVTIKDYAVAIQKEKKDYLTLEEIEGILAMNSKLVF